MNYYNEHDPKAAEWLRELIRQGHIPAGEVDTRSIRDVCATDLVRFTQCHFFAGIGGWSLALRLAGWPDDKPVWTGSCPCQPFSAAGKQMGTADSRHLWPAFRRLILHGAPPVVFGEQVASALGRQWLAGIRANLETLGYAVGAADLCAAGVGAPHIRQRLFWAAGRLGDTDGEQDQPSKPRQQEPAARRDFIRGHGPAVSGIGKVYPGGLAQSHGDGRQSWQPSTAPDRHGNSAGPDGRNGWSAYDLLPCRDGKARRIEPGTFPLAYGVPGRVGLLRGYGNAIVPQVAAEFIQAYLEAKGELSAP